jgi:long-chain fatty acid transport protein
MKRTLLSFAVLGAVLATGTAQAGGWDRTGQDTSIILKEGNLLEVTSVSVNPSVTGAYSGGNATGEVVPDYSFTTMSFRTDINDEISIAVIQEKPFGAGVSWTSGALYGSYQGVEAKIKSSSTTLLASYDLDNVTIYGGLKNQSMSASNTNPLMLAYGGAYNITSTEDSSLGYVFGAAFEKPEIAMRVALTFHSKVSHDIAISETLSDVAGNVLSTTPGILPTKTPESFNLDFQTGIAENTLLFGTIRQVKWTQLELTPPVYKSIHPKGASLKKFTSDTTSYTLGLGRKFSDQWSGAVTYGTESAEGVGGSALGPTDGYSKMGVGVTYTGEKASVTLGVQKVNLGDTEITGSTATTTASMTGNTTLVTAVKVGYKF